MDNNSYIEHISILLDDTTEFVGSYIRNFRKLGIEAECSIANDNNLQGKWGSEHEIDPDNRQEILFDQVNSFSPDILLIENLGAVTPDLLKHIRRNILSVRLIIANHCSPFNLKVIASLKEVDFVITCTPGLKSNTEAMGKKSFLIYHGFDNDLLHRINVFPETQKNDFIFSGSLIAGGDFHTQRIRLIERILEEKINIGLYVNLESKYRIMAKQSIYLFSAFLKKIKMEHLFNNFQFMKYGNTRIDTYSTSLLKHKNPPVYGTDMFNLFLNSKIVLNFHIGVAGDYAGNMRMFEVTGVGSCLLTDNKKNMNELFDVDSEVVAYDNPDDCVAKVKWLLDHEEERKKIALAGQQKTLKYHSVENRCRSVVEIIQSELKFTH
ncbi:MAG TPA: glycosyltransferase [Anaerovoracaceae bacterium]|nr:glycosyltransferase [Anaerovoracaceae bacterium]